MKKSNPLAISLYNIKDEVPHDILLQVFNMAADCARNQLGYYTDIGSSRILELPSLTTFFNGTNEQLYVAKIYDKKLRSFKAVGYLHVVIDDSKTTYTRNNTWIHNIWVDPQCRRKGIGKAMVRYMFDVRDGSEYGISCYCNNLEGNSFWRSLGFVNALSTTYTLNWEGENYAW